MADENEKKSCVPEGADERDAPEARQSNDMMNGWSSAQGGGYVYAGSGGAKGGAEATADPQSAEDAQNAEAEPQKPEWTHAEDTSGQTAEEHQTGWTPGAGFYRQERRPADEWNFKGYDDFENAGAQGEKRDLQPQPPEPQMWQAPPKKKKKGGRIFAGILCGIIALALVCFAGYGIWSMLSPGQGYVPYDGESSSVEQEPHHSIPEDNGEQSSLPEQVPVENDISIDRNHSGITIVDRPEGGGDGSVELPWTVEVSERVLPTVVGIEIFASDYELAHDDDEISPESSGSGIIMSEDGYILTNAHVVAGAYKIRVTLYSGEKYAATVVGLDRITDLAVIRIDAKRLPFAEFGNSDQMKVGEFVLAIGNPGGMSLQGSVTYGMVSAVNREIRTSNSTLVCIQTDAAINPGNSGGALVNQYGQIIGINSAKIALEGYEGIGFAIASNHAKPIVDELIRYGRVTGRIQLGITAQLISQAQAMQSGVKPGMYIVDITNHDISDQGVQPGDIITHIDGVAVTSFNGVSEQLAQFKAGDKVTLSIYRPATRTSPSSSFEVEISLVQDTVEDEEK